MNIASALSTTIGSQSHTTLVVSGVLAVVISIFGYRLSQRIRATRGVTPWRIPSLVWALICFFFAPFGFALELIAIVSTKPEPGNIQPAHGATNSTANRASHAVYETTNPKPASTEEALIAYAPKIPPSGYGGPQSDQLGKSALFGWYHDVSGHHQLRYWDGRDWTRYVSDNDVQSEDPLS